jgi:hypothetical protein
MNTKEKTQAIASFYQELADNDNGFTYESSQVDYMPGPNLDTVDKCIKFWKVNPPKPKFKTIDLSIMVGSDIDMEFGGNEFNWISQLVKIDKGYYSKHSGAGWYDNCRIRQNHWHSWQGGECPLPEGLFLDVITRNSVKARRVKLYNTSQYWFHSQSATDIIAFKVIGTVDGYTYDLTTK